MMLTLTSPHRIWAHRLPAGAKLAALALTTLALFHLTTPLPLALALAVILALIATGGRTFAMAALISLRPLWPFLLIVALWHLWRGDVPGGAVILLRLTAAVAAATFVTMTTTLADMIAVITWLARPLALIGLQPQTLAVAVALTIRFLPVMLIHLTRIREAIRARSPRRPGWRVMTPVLLITLDDADRVAEALRARGGAG
jgi:biotin transport system permease protein